MSERKQETKDRAARAAAIRADQQRQERRRTVLAVGATLMASVLLTGAAGSRR